MVIELRPGVYRVKDEFTTWTVREEHGVWKVINDSGKVFRSGSTYDKVMWQVALWEITNR